MNRLEPQDLANLWYLKFGYKWVKGFELDADWKKISRELMRSNLADYDTMLMVDTEQLTEIVKLKKHANN
jgi:hypothetical protein